MNATETAKKVKLGSIGANIKKMREEMGFSQKQLIEAANLDIAQGRVSQLENGDPESEVIRSTVEQYQKIVNYYEYTWKPCAIQAIQGDIEIFTRKKREEIDRLKSHSFDSEKIYPE